MNYHYLFGVYQTLNMGFLTQANYLDPAKLPLYFFQKESEYSVELLKSKIESILSRYQTDSESEIISDDINELKNILKDRWERIKETSIAYPYNTKLLANQWYLQIAIAIAQENEWMKFLMPTLTETSNILGDDYSNGQFPIHQFVLSDDHQRLIDILVCLQNYRDNGRFEETTLGGKGGYDQSLTETEKRRVINHSQESKAYYNAIESLHEFQRNPIVLGSLLQLFIDHLRSGDAAHKGQELQAGQGAYEAIATFQAQMDSVPESLKGRLLSAKNKHGKTFESVWKERIVRQMSDAKDSRNCIGIQFCVQGSVRYFEEILQDNKELLYGLNINDPEERTNWFTRIFKKRTAITSPILISYQDQVDEQKIRLEKYLRITTLFEAKFSHDQEDQSLMQHFVEIFPDILIELKDKITTFDILIQVLEQLPESSRLSLAIECKSKIDDADKFARILQKLPISHRIIFQTNFVTNGDQLILVLSSSTLDDPLRFVNEHKNKITTFDLLIQVINLISENIRLGFAKECKNKVEEGDQLARVLDKLPNDDRLSFANECKDKITTFDLLIQVINLLPENVRLGFAIGCKDKVKKRCQLECILDKLPKSDRLNFASECKSEIITFNSWDLLVVLNLLPENVRLKFAEECKDKIKDSDQLACVLDKLPNDVRLRLAEECKTKIKDGDQLAHVLDKLPNDVRLRFAEECEAKIKDGDQLAKVLKKLLRGNRLRFAERHKQIICVFSELSCDDRFSFLQECNAKITTFLEILKTLREQDQLTFAQQMSDEVETRELSKKGNAIFYLSIYQIIRRKMPEENPNSSVFFGNSKKHDIKAAQRLKSKINEIPGDIISGKTLRSHLFLNPKDIILLTKGELGERYKKIQQSCNEIIVVPR